MAGVNLRFATISEVEILKIQEDDVPENREKATKLDLNVFKDWFVQQNEFSTDIEEMEKEELNKCLGKFYVATRKQHGSHYNKAMLTSIRATIDRYLRNERNNKPFSIIVDSEFTEANKALNSLLKSLCKSGEICSTVHKPALTVEAVGKYEAGRCKHTRPKKASTNSVVFHNTLLWSKRTRKPEVADKNKAKAFQNSEFRSGIL
ncbi:uncharacterized protein [Montipora foliosa]|uniref:uncharacterized protein n=1 Tax=Montipora foliosa TaxID=591990 RepID=UPI0035F1436B